MAGKAKRFNNYDSDVEQQRKLVKSYGEIRQSNSVSSFRSSPQSPPIATNTNNEAVVVDTTVANNSITFAKIQDIATMKVIGRTATGSGDSSEISILDEDNMASNSATSLATQQSIKAYVDANGGGSTSFVGFTADDDLSMGTYNIDGIDQLLFSTATSSDSPAWNTSNYGFEIAGGTTPTALDIRVPTGKFVNVKVAGTTEFEFKSNELDVNDNDICNVGTVFTDFISKSSGNTMIKVWGHLDPISDGDYDLGSNSLRWRKMYLSDDLDVEGDVQIDDDLNVSDNISVSGNLTNGSGHNGNLTWSGSGYVSFSSTNTYLYSDTTWLGNVGGSDLVKIQAQLDFRENTNTTNQTASDSDGYISIKVGGLSKKLYYYS